MTDANTRVADYRVDDIYLQRWSPRAFTTDAIAEDDLRQMFEAARWAPSAYNSQPWRFLFARRGTQHWDKFLSLLAATNQVWAKNAAALAVLVSKKAMKVPGKDVPIESYSHSLDAGTAWGFLSLEAARMGWAAHGMVGFDMSRAAAELHVPADHRIELAIAIGKPGDRSILPEALAAREAPSGRQPQAQFTFEGGFPPPTVI